MRKKSQEQTIADINQRIREFVMDTKSPNAYDYSLLLGCAPLSDELQEHEYEESDKRTEKIAYLYKYLHAYARSLAEATTEFYRSKAGKTDAIPDEAWRQTKRLIDQVSLSVLIGAVSQLVDMGLLEIPRRRK